MAKLKELLAKDLTKKELAIMPTSFDVVGDILIFADFPKELKKKEKKIAEKILATYKNIKVICKKIGNYGGTFRTPTLRIMAGERRKTTIHKENNVQVKLHVEKVYFSSRLAHERDRINKLIKKNESVLVMFSGCGVYPLNISKNTSAKEIYGVEINPDAHKYAEENTKLNKVNNITLFNGDVNNVLPKIKKKFDRVLMPLPKSAADFLDIAIKKVKKGGILHFYDFLNEKEFGESEKKIKEACKKHKGSCRILRRVKCGQYGPGKFRICVDVKVN